MRLDIENIYSVLPFGNDIKYNIYKQMYKNQFTISSVLKRDLQTFLMLNRVILTYQREFDTNYMDENYFLYNLYNDLIHEHQRNIMDLYNNSDALFHNYYFESIIKDTMQIHNIQRIQYPFLIKRIRYFWKLFSVNQRLYFMKLMELKFIDSKTKTVVTNR